MKELMLLLEEFEKRNKMTCVSITIHTDGSGTIDDWNDNLFTFDTEDQAIDFLKNKTREDI
jgi:hypothetical protein